MEMFNCFLKIQEQGEALYNEKVRNECYRYLKDWFDSYFAMYSPDMSEFFDISAPTGILNDIISIRSPKGGAPSGTCAKIMSLCMRASVEIRDKLSLQACSSTIVDVHDSVMQGEAPEFSSDVQATVIHYTPGFPDVYLEKRDIGLSEKADPEDTQIEKYELGESFVKKPRPY